MELNTDFSKDEQEILIRCAGTHYKILTSIEGDSFVLNVNGKYKYNECFYPVEEKYFLEQSYEKVIPFRIIRFFNFI